MIVSFNLSLYLMRIPVFANEFLQLRVSLLSLSFENLIQCVLNILVLHIIKKIEVNIFLFLNSYTEIYFLLVDPDENQRGRKSYFES